MFKLDSPLMNFLNKVADIMIINILVLLCSLPIVTAGAAITAGYYMCYKMVRNEETYIFKGFMKSFKENFKQSTILWVIMVTVAGLLVIDFKLMSADGAEFASWLQVAIMAASIVVALGTSFVFPMQARFSNTVKNTIKNAFLMAMSHLPTAIVSVVAIAIPVALLYYLPMLTPMILLLVFGGVIYGKSYLFLRVFRKYEDAIRERMGDNSEPESEDSGIFAISDEMEKCSEKESR